MRDSMRVAVVDDHPIFCRGLASVLAANDEFQLVAQGSHRDDVQKILVEHRPHILLLDILLRSDGVRALKDATHHATDTKIVIVTASEKSEHVSIASLLGARGFVLKTETEGALTDAMKTVHVGGTYLTHRLAADMFRDIKRRKAAMAIKSELKSLTKRESEILNFVGRGLTNKEIAIKLGIREKTVKHYMTIIMNKLQVQNRVQAALMAQKSETAHTELGLVG